MRPARGLQHVDAEGDLDPTRLCHEATTELIRQTKRPEKTASLLARCMKGLAAEGHARFAQSASP